MCKLKMFQDVWLCYLVVAVCLLLLFSNKSSPDLPKFPDISKTQHLNPRARKTKCIFNSISISESMLSYITFLNQCCRMLHFWISAVVYYILPYITYILSFFYKYVTGCFRCFRVFFEKHLKCFACQRRYSFFAWTFY